MNQKLKQQNSSRQPQKLRALLRRKQKLCSYQKSTRGLFDATKTTCGGMKKNRKRNRLEFFLQCEYIFYII